MEYEERAQATKLVGMINVKKQGLLNKFLTKTFHMIDTCDPGIASWTDDGNSFIIKDVKEFSKTVLPRFFKHSKFPSFVRQLNFYSFRKLRPPSDSRGISPSKCVRFAHECFRRGQPELLHRIQRITKSQDVCSTEVRSLRDEISEVSEELCSFSTKMEQRFRSMKAALDLDYQQRMTTVTLSYQVLSSVALQLASVSACKPTPSSIKPPMSKPQSPPTAPSPPPTSVWKSVDMEKPTSPTSVSGISPLMALSMVAAMDREQEFYST